MAITTGKCFNIIPDYSVVQHNHAHDAWTNELIRRLQPTYSFLAKSNEFRLAYAAGHPPLISPNDLKSDQSYGASISAIRHRSRLSGSQVWRTHTSPAATLSAVQTHRVLVLFFCFLILLPKGQAKRIKWIGIATSATLVHTYATPLTSTRSERGHLPVRFCFFASFSLSRIRNPGLVVALWPSVSTMHHPRTPPPCSIGVLLASK